MIRMLVCLFALSLLCSTVSVCAGEKRDTAMALLTGADSLITAGDHAKAADMCKRALAEDETCPAAYFKLAQCQEQLSKPRDAFKSYRAAADLAKKENDATLARKATSAAEKLGAGLIQISTADQKLIDKLVPLADEALNDDQFETARQAYQSVLAISPTHEKAKAGLEKAEKAIEERGDPVKAKIAAAMLAEIFYLVGTDKKDEARKMAADVSSRHANTPAGKEAAQLLADNFEAPKNLNAQLAEAKKELREIAEKQTKKASAKPVSSVSTSSAPKAAGLVDVDAMERVAMDDAKKVSKDSLVPTYKETYAKGKDFFAKATPGSEGNQANLRGALENFIRCEALYMRIDEEKLADADIEAMQKQAGTSRYSCMKMTILSH